jgi:hypothetical protein
LYLTMGGEGWGFSNYNMGYCSDPMVITLLYIVY